jgi:hypothetical protein
MDQVLSSDEVKANLAKLYGQLTLVEDLLDTKGTSHPSFTAQADRIRYARDAKS